MVDERTDQYPPTTPMPSLTSFIARHRVTAALAVAAAAYSWWYAGLPGRTSVRAAAVAGPLAIGGGVAVWSWITRGRPPHSIHARARWRWTAVAALLVMWELHELFGGPRVDYPTVTSIVTGMATWRTARAVAFLSWLAIGYRLIEREPRPTPVPVPVRVGPVRER